MNAIIDDAERWLAGDGDAALEARLQARFADDPAALRRIVDHYRCERVLRELPAIEADPAHRRAFAAQVVKELRRAPGPQRPRSSRRPAPRRGLPWWVLGLGVAAVLMGAVIIGQEWGASADSGVWGTIIRAPAPVSIERDGRTFVLGVGERLRVGDALVARGSAVRVRDRRAVMIACDPGTRVQLRRQEAVACAVMTGRVRVEVPPQSVGGSWILTTPHAEVAVVGTRFTVRVDDGGTDVTVTTGTVRTTARHDGTSRVLEAGARARIAATTAESSPPEGSPRLIAHWTFAEGRGRISADRTGHGHELRLINGASWDAGRADGALRMSGRGVLHVDGHPDLDLTAGSVCLWIRPSAPLPEQFARLGQGLPMEFVSKMDWPAKSGYEIVRPAFDDVGHWGIRLGHGSDGHTYAGATVPERTDWIHLAATWSPDGAARLYVDGTAVASEPMAAATMVANDKPLAIGNRFNGLIDEVRLYDGVLKPAAIAALAAEAVERE